MDVGVLTRGQLEEAARQVASGFACEAGAFVVPDSGAVLMFARSDLARRRFGTAVDALTFDGYADGELEWRKVVYRAGESVGGPGACVAQVFPPPHVGPLTAAADAAFYVWLAIIGSYTGLDARYDAALAECGLPPDPDRPDDDIFGPGDGSGGDCDDIAF